MSSNEMLPPGLNIKVVPLKQIGLPSARLPVRMNGQVPIPHSGHSNCPSPSVSTNNSAGSPAPLPLLSTKNSPGSHVPLQSRSVNGSDGSHRLFPLASTNGSPPGSNVP